MRVIDAFDREVQAVAVSADGRFLAASTGQTVALWDWTGGEVWRAADSPAHQLAFSPDGCWLAAGGANDLRLWPTDGRPPTRPPSAPGRGSPAGGVAFAPSGKHLVASRGGTWPHHDYGFAHGISTGGSLDRWFVPTWHPLPGFNDHLPAFSRLAFSPDGEYVAGINARRCEFRFVHSGGLQTRVQMRGHGRHAFLSFAPDGHTAVCGWDAELHVIDPRGGKDLRQVGPKEAPFRDAAFTGGAGRQVGAVDEAGVLRLLDAATWEEARAYDWRAGPLTCVGFTPDGMAGVCGTGHGQLILFDLD
jgi:WD40 repeat protein